MKKLLITATWVVMAAFITEAKENTKVDKEVTAAFTAAFEDAVNVNWTKENDFYIAHFTLENKNVTAVYSADKAELVGLLRTIDASNLPLSIKLYINKKYKGYALNGSVTEIGSPDTDAYIFTLENEKQFLKLKMDTNGFSTVLQKVKKA